MRSLAVGSGLASDLAPGASVSEVVWAGATQVRLERGGLTAWLDGAQVATRATQGGVDRLLGSRSGQTAWSTDGAGAVVAWDVERAAALGSHALDGTTQLLAVSADGALAAVAAGESLFLLESGGDVAQELPHPDVHGAAIRGGRIALATKTGLYVYSTRSGILEARTSTMATAITWLTDDVLGLASGRTVRTLRAGGDEPRSGDSADEGVKSWLDFSDDEAAVWTSAGSIHGVDTRGRLGDACVEDAVAAVSWDSGRRKPMLLVARASGFELLEPRRCKVRGSASLGSLDLIAAGAGSVAWGIGADCSRWAWSPGGELVSLDGEGVCSTAVVAPSGAALLQVDGALVARDAEWSPRPLTGVPAEIVDLQASDARVATLDADGGLALWDPATLASVAVRSTAASGIALGSDGRPAMASDGEVAVLDPQSLETVRRWDASAPGAVAWSGDGRLLAFADGPQVVVVDPNVDQPVARWSETGPVSALAWRPDGAGLAVGVAHAVVFRSSTGQREGATSAGRVTAVAWSPDGQWLAIGDASGRVRVEGAAGLAERGGPLALRGPVTAATFSPDGAIWTVGGPHGRLIRMGEGSAVSAVADAPITALTEADRLLVGTETGGGWWTGSLEWLWAAPKPRARELEVAGDIWVERGEQVWVRGLESLVDTPVQAAAVAPDGTVATALDGLQLRRKGSEPVGVALPGQPALLDWSPDGETLAVATTEGDIALVRGETAEAEVVRRGIGQPVKMAVGNGTRGLVVTGAERVWQFGTWASKSPTEGIAPVDLVSMGPDHAVLPVDGGFRHTDLRGGGARTLEWEGAPVASIEVGAGGRALLLGEDGSWTVWDPRRRKTWSYGTQALSTLAVDPGSRFLVVGTSTGDVWTWSLERGAPTAILETGGGAVRALDVDRLGQVLWANAVGMGLDARRWFEGGLSAVALDGDQILGFGSDRVVAVRGTDVLTRPIQGLGSPHDVRGTDGRWSALASDGGRLVVDVDRRVATRDQPAVALPGSAGGLGVTWRAVADAGRGTVTLHGPSERVIAVDDITDAAVDEAAGLVWTAGEDGCIRAFALETGALRSAWWVGPKGKWAAWDARTGWRSGGLTVTTW